MTRWTILKRNNFINIFKFTQIHTRVGWYTHKHSFRSAGAAGVMESDNGGPPPISNAAMWEWTSINDLDRKNPPPLLSDCTDLRGVGDRCDVCVCVCTRAYCARPVQSGPQHNSTSTTQLHRRACRPQWMGVNTNSVGTITFQIRGDGAGGGRGLTVLLQDTVVSEEMSVCRGFPRQIHL